jgi:DNA-binding NarL/FixJ family response regulator
MSDRVRTNGAAAAGVLICDDNEAVRALIGMIVDRAFGLTVVGEAADGNEAIVEATRLQPDVIILDLAMPRLSGLEAIPALRRVAPGSQIIVFSGFARSSVAEHVLALGAVTYLEKGASPETIVETIEQALGDAAGLQAPLTKLG